MSSPQLKDRFGGIGGFKGNPFLFGLNKEGFFDIAVDKVAPFNFGADKAAVIEV
jgi:hypothetical protein